MPVKSITLSVVRVILTSSIVAMIGDKKRGPFTPEDWTDVNAKDFSTYAKSKTLAEGTVGGFMKHRTDQNRFELVVLNLGSISGPTLGEKYRRTVAGCSGANVEWKQPVASDAAFTMVDVRDVAKIHVQALTHPDAANHRFILSSTTRQSFASVARIMKHTQYKRPSTPVAPDFMIKIMSIFDREAKGLLGFIGSSVHADNSRTIEIFDWDPSPFEKSILESESVVKIFLNRILILVNEKNFHCVIEKIKFNLLIFRKSL